MTTCRTCGESYSEFGDGWDGECPTCADRSYAADEKTDAKEAAQRVVHDTPGDVIGDDEVRELVARHGGAWELQQAAKNAIAEDRVPLEVCAQIVRDFTEDEVGVCLAGNPAVNGVCGDPDCVCAP